MHKETKRVSVLPLGVHMRFNA